MYRRIINSSFTLIAFAILITACNPSGIKELSPKEFEMQLELNGNHVLIDVCTPEEYNEKHIKTAVNINYYSEYFDNDVSKIDNNTTLFVYCALGARSSEAAKRLEKSGYTDIYTLKGGINAWRSAGLDVKFEN